MLQLRDGSSQKGGTKSHDQGIESSVEGSMSIDDQCIEMVQKLKKKYKKVFTMGENELKPMCNVWQISNASTFK